MSLEESINKLAIAMTANTAALSAQSEAVNNMMSATPAVKEEKPVKDKKAAVKEKVASKKTAAAKKVGPVKTEGAALTGEIESETALDADGVQSHLRAVASQLEDTSKLFALIQKHGGQQFSDLDPSVYAILVQEADALVEAGA